MNLDKHYPAAPANVPAELTQPSPAFRAEVRNVILAIVAFIFTYLALVALAVALAWFCLKAGLVVMALRLSWITILIGLGIMIVGILVVFFMLKFLFASSSGSAELGGIQIHEGDEPELFAFIGRVAGEVGTPFPRKIYLIPDVNASVFYESSFWSLFAPTGKNLNIGIGLVNSLNLSEFKAVLAHEFGHFSQKSMSLGSYVYYVNQVIFNLLYRNSGWAGTANSIAGSHEILYFFVRMAVYIVQGVQWILRGMYGIINRQYKSLSRQMEFHADAISASVSGSNNMAQALRQVELGADTYQHTLQTCNELLQDEKAPRNAYVGQRVMATQIASVNNLPLRNGLPVVTTEFVAQQQHERVNFKDQWASHPTRAEREASLQKIGLEAPVLEDSAWVIFQNPEHLQRSLTEYLYRNVNTKVENLENEAFARLIETQRAARELPKIYQGYYYSHIMNTEKWTETEANTTPQKLERSAVDELFKDNLDNKIAAQQRDIETLGHIANGEIDTKSFDFDGKKQPAEEAANIQGTLARELEKMLEERNRHDARASAAFYAHAQATNAAAAEKLRTLHRNLQALSMAQLEFNQHARIVVPTIHELAVNGYVLLTALADPFRQMTDVHEPALRAILQKEAVRNLISAELQEKVKDVFYSPEPLLYHEYSQLHQSNLEKLMTVTLEIANYWQRMLYDRQKEVLELQERVL